MVGWAVQYLRKLNTIMMTPCPFSSSNIKGPCQLSLFRRGGGGKKQGYNAYIIIEHYLIPNTMQIVCINGV